MFTRAGSNLALSSATKVHNILNPRHSSRDVVQERRCASKVLSVRNVSTLSLPKTFTIVPDRDSLRDVITFCYKLYRKKR